MPTAKQQAAFLLEGVQELLYGGGTRGGKSWWLLGEALRHVDIPGYSAILFRNTIGDLTQEPDGLIPTLRGWLEPHLESSPGLRWVGSTRTWHFPSGATISFGYLMDQAGERYRRYAGPSWHMIGVDQAELLNPNHYVFLFSRLSKKVGTPYPLRFRATANPGGPAHDFLVERFNLLGRYPNPVSGRAFMPALLDDNPHVDRSYEKSLLALGEVEYRRLRHGDFSITTSGVFFKTERLLAAAAPPASAALVRAWDLAATEEGEGHDPDYTVGLLLAREGLREWVVDVVRDRLSPDGIDDLMAATAARDGYAVPILIEQEGRSAGKREIAHIRRRLQGHTVIGREAKGTKTSRAAQAARWVNQGKDPTTELPLAVFVCDGPWVPAFVTELRGFTGTGKAHDDQVDAFAYAHNYLDENAGVWQPQAGALEAAARVVAPPA